METVQRDVGVAGEISSCCLELQKEILLAPPDNLSPKHQKAMRRAYQSMWMWGETHNVTCGSLDSILQTSEQLMKIVIIALRQILSFLFHGMLEMSFARFSQTFTDK